MNTFMEKSKQSVKSIQELEIFIKNYSDKQDSRRLTEFPQIRDTVYLDHAGATLYSNSQIELFASEIKSKLLGNPHSRNASSKLSTELVEHIRWKILKYFNTSHNKYSIIFTSGCTSALKLVAETFCFNYENNNSGCFCYLEDNHTSVLGVREPAAIKNTAFWCLSVKNAFNIFNDNFAPQSSVHSAILCNCQTSNCSCENVRANSLFAYPAQSNFSGYRYPLEWISKAQDGQLKRSNTWCVLLDAASFVTTAPLDLDMYSPDFVTLSFYKMFGFPTGLGALLVKNSSSHFLKKTYFGGGAVQVSLASERYHVNRPTVTEMFEDGTISFLDIIALQHGFDTLQKLGGSPADICSYTFQLAKYTYNCLMALKHFDGSPVSQIYTHSGFTDLVCQGPIIAFNLLDSSGHIIGFSRVEKLADINNIHLRTGCFCNIGACQFHLGLSSQQIKNNFEAGHVCGDDLDLIDGQPTGCVRISFGYMSTIKDADIFIKFVADNFMEKTARSDIPSGIMLVKKQLQSWTLSQMYIYPVKSAAAVEVTTWPLGRRGLKYDRQWMVVTEGGAVISQKRTPQLCLVQPLINEKLGVLTLSFAGYDPISVPLSPDQNNATISQQNLCCTRICGDRVHTIDCGDNVAQWLEKCLDIIGVRLLRQLDNDTRSVVHQHSKENNDGCNQATDLTPNSLLSLANEAQLLITCQPSMEGLLNCSSSVLHDEHKLSPEQAIVSLGLRFRPNLVLDGPGPPFIEDSWKRIIIGQNAFSVQGRCIRCQMICVDQSTGTRSKEPLQTLVQTLKRNSFGLLLQSPTTENLILSVGSPVDPT